VIGQQVSHYRIVEKIGEGGMGVIYRAHDTRLQRAVALKVLRHDRPLDREQRRRLLTEARAASALDHPNILTVYDILNWHGNDVIVMEFVHGRTLRRMLASGPLPVADALDYSVQICTAVAVAHEAGVVHRNLKPGNIMVGEHGKVKVLDFGLAKRAAWSGSCDTMSAPATQPGLFMGTPDYASPEQLAGLPADARSDVLSFGVMLYEMLTGRRPFAGAVTRDEPPLARTLRPELPEALDGIVSKALARDPAELSSAIIVSGLKLRHAATRSRRYS
jgi:serine/threonine-protein kinase